MDLVLSGLHWTHCLVYLDDIIVFAPTVEEHLKRLDVVLDRIETAGLTLKPAKCQWLGRLGKFLGHIVPEEGVTVDPAKVSSVKNFPIPQNKTDRTKDADNVFQELKNCLISAPVLQCPDVSLQFKLYTDACDYGLGAVLAQETDDGEAVIAYANRILKPSEAKYAVLQKEALDVQFNMIFWRYDVIQLQKQDEYAGKWIVFLSEGELPSDKDVANKMVKEKENFVVGDDGMLYRKCKTKTGHARRQLVAPKLQIGQILMRMHDHQLSGRPGFFRTPRKVQQKYIWPKMKSSIKRHIRHCGECAEFKSPKPAGKKPVKSIVTSRPLQIVAMDFVGPLPKSDRGNMYALVMVDHFSRWPVMYSVDNIEAETVTVKLQDFIHTYGCPEELLSDRGSHFTAELIKALTKQTGVKKIYTCAFRPSTNGLNEHLNGTLFQGVKMYVSKRPSTRDQYPDALVFAYRTMPHSVTQHTPAFLMFGRELNSPLDMKPPTRLYTVDPVKSMQNERQLAYEIVKNLVSKEQARQKKHHDKNLPKVKVTVGEKVWLRDFIIKKGTSKKFHQPWKEPYEVVKIVGENNVEINIGGTKREKTKRVNLEQIKKANEADGSPSDIAEAAYCAFTAGCRHKFNYTLRTIPCLNEHLNPVEDVIHHKLIPALCEGRSCSDDESLLLSLPVKLGGLGIPDLTKTAAFEYDASKSITEQCTKNTIRQNNPVVEGNDYALVNSDITKKKSEYYASIIAFLRENMTSSQCKAYEIACSDGASIWLSSLPLKSKHFHLSKREFPDGIFLKYTRNLKNLPSECVCKAKFSVDHALSCKIGGFVTL
eukprot:gene11438-biopygen9117